MKTLIIASAVGVVFALYTFLYRYFRRLHKERAVRAPTLPPLSDRVKAIVVHPSLSARMEAAKAHGEETGLALMDARLAVDHFIQSLPAPESPPLKHWPMRYWLVSGFAAAWTIYYSWFVLNGLVHGHYAQSMLCFGCVPMFFQTVRRPQPLADGLKVPLSKWSSHSSQYSRGARVSPATTALFSVSSLIWVAGLILLIAGIS